MVRNLDSQVLHDFLVGDFEVAWNAVAATAAATHRGNFMFARQAMALLEFAARLCTNDKSGDALRAFSDEIERIEARYFTPMPGVCMNVGDFELPSSPGRGPREQQLLWALFDLIRHGQAHQGQQINVELADGKVFMIGLTGADHQLTLDRARVAAGGRPEQHLAFRVAPEGIGLDIVTHMLFLDFRDAISRAKLLARGLKFPYLERPRRPGHYNFDSGALESALKTGRHGRVEGKRVVVP